MGNRNSDILPAVGVVFLGVAAGVVLGMICAPRSGEETRKQLAEYPRRVLFRLRWVFWSPEQRYRYLWNQTRAERAS